MVRRYVGYQKKCMHALAGEPAPVFSFVNALDDKQVADLANLVLFATELTNKQP